MKPSICVGLFALLGCAGPVESLGPSAGKGSDAGASVCEEVTECAVEGTAAGFGYCAKWHPAGAPRLHCGIHTTSVLRSGALVVGECAFAGEPSRLGAWVYRVAADAWHELSTSAPRRSNHAAATLLDGRILLVGGHSAAGGVLEDSVIYEPETDRWIDAGAVGPRVDSTATRLPDGRVFVAGGDDQGSTLIFDPATGVWTPGPALQRVRRKHAALLLSDHLVMLIGGLQQGRHLHNVETLDLLSGAWIDGPALPVAHATAGIVTADGPLVVSGAVYRLQGDTWRSSEEFTRPYPAVAMLPGARIFIVGDSVWELITAPKIYDSKSGRWAVGPQMLERAGHIGNATTTVMPDGAVLLVGAGPAQLYRETRSATSCP